MSNSKPKFNIATSSGKIFILRNNVVKSDGAIHERHLPAAQFLIDRGVHVSDPSMRIIRIRPVDQPNKYIGVVGSSVVLKNVPGGNNVSDFSYDFEEEVENAHFMKLKYINSAVNQVFYLTAKRSGDIVLGRYKLGLCSIRFSPAPQLFARNAVLDSFSAVPEFNNEGIFKEERIAVSEE